MHVRILGSAAGGGSPQWNCRCEIGEAARAGVRARPRTQSSVAIRGCEGPWFVVNVSPDVRHAFPVLSILGRYCGVRWQTLHAGCPTARPDGLEIEL